MPARKDFALNPTESAPIPLLVVIVAAALLVRLAVAYRLGITSPLDSDEIVYGKAAASLVSGHGFMINGVTTAKCLPGWPLFLACAYALFGVHPVVGRTLTCLLGALATLPLGLAAHRAGGRMAALLAAGAAALYPPMVFYSSQALTETPTIFWLAIAIWLLFEGRARGHRGLFLAAGLAFGLGSLTRGAVVAFAGAACLALFAVPRRDWPGALGRSALIVGGAALVVMPWIIRNTVVFGRATVSTQSQTQLWQGAHPGASGLNRIDWPRTKEKFAELRGLGEVAMSDAMGREAKAFIREHPGEFVRLGFIKAWELWKPWSPNVSFVENLAYALDATPLAIVGIAAAFSRRRTRYDQVFLLAGLALFTLMHMIYTAIVRYRVAADAILIVYAAIFVAELIAQRAANIASRLRPDRAAAQL